MAEYPEPAAEPDETADPHEDAPRRARRPGRSRAARARRRKSQRRLVTVGSVLAVVAIGAAIYVYLSKPHTQGSSWVTTLQPGEYRAVPNACHAVPATVLSAALAGTPRAVQTYPFTTESQCSYTVEAKPVFRILTVTAQAFQPGAYGDGSATANARYMFGLTKGNDAHPPKGIQQPAAQVTPLTGLGTDAFSAVGVYRGGSITDDRVTVMILFRNVQITAEIKAQVSGGYGPVSDAQLEAGAVAAARAMLAAVKAAPAVS